MLSYPDVNKKFVIYTDASDYTIGGLVTQEGRTISCFSKKLNPAQQRYTTTDKELLAVDETLKYHHNIIYGCDIEVMTDHKNLTHNDTKHVSQRVLCQRLSINQNYQAKLIYYEGTLNEGADGLSILPFDDDSKIETTQEIYLLETSQDRNFNEHFPMDLRIVAREQDRDDSLKKVKEKESAQDKLGTIEMNGHKMCTVNGLICITTSMQTQILQWYHRNLQHAGTTRMLATIGIHFRFPGIRAAIEDLIKHCEECQRYKITGKRQYGILPLTPALRDTKPWEVVHVDCCGPWNVKYEDLLTATVVQQKIQLLTMVDACLGWPEFAVIHNMTAKHIAHAFDRSWLCRYPRPSKCIYDNGSEFIGREFQEMLESYSIQPAPTTVKNPQANAIIERMHGPLGDQLRCTTFRGSNWHDELDTIVQACAFAIRTTVPLNSPYAPAQMTFGMDMIFRQKVIVDWDKIKQLRQKQTEHNKKRENNKQIPHDYKVGDKILLVTPISERRRQAKLSPPTEGPYEITKLYKNGTVKILRKHFEEIVSIRRIRPYFTKL